MAENSESNGNHGVVLNVKDGNHANHDPPTFASISKPNHEARLCVSIPFMQKVTSHLLQTIYYLPFLLYLEHELNNKYYLSFEPI